MEHSIITPGYSRRLDGVDRLTNPLPPALSSLQHLFTGYKCGETLHVPKFLWIFFVRLSTTIHIFVRHFYEPICDQETTLAFAVKLSYHYKRDLAPPEREQK
jgi:hypothetical protein